MNEIEEKIWSYIDGVCTAQEHEAISKLIEQDAHYRSKYEELLLLNAELQSLELDEPPMAFTYNVMENIRAEEAKQPLKATINKKVVAILAGIFVIAIAIMIVTAARVIHQTASGSVNDALAMLKLPSVKIFISAPIIKAFIFFDVLLALALFDGYLRKQKFSKAA